MSKLFSHLIKNENIKTTSLIVSRNVFGQSFPKPIASKSQDWKEVPKKFPTLSLKLNSPSNKLSLDVSDKNFCHICNASTCKLLTAKDENEEQVPKYDSNTITIVVDREELCRTICGSNDESDKLPTNESVAHVDKESEYCALCKAPKCKLKENGSKEQSSDNVDKESQYCDLCKASKCKLIDKSPENPPSKRKNVLNDSNKSKIQRKDYSTTKARTSYTNIEKNSPGRSLRDTNSSESPNNASKERASESVDKGSEYCALCDAPKCKLEENESKEQSSDNVDKGSEYCDLCKAPKCELLAKLSDDIDEPKSESPNETVEKGSEYCDLCKAPKCKLIDNSADNPPDKGNNASSDTITDANKKDDSSTNEQASNTNLKPKNNVDTKNPDFCSSCNLPKCKYESSEPFKSGTRKTKNSNRMSNSAENIAISMNQSKFMVYKNSAKKTKSTPNMNEIQMDGDNRKNKSGKGTNFGSSYEIDNNLGN